MAKTVAAAIHAALVARINCRESGNQEWLMRWTRYLDRLAKECLPSGSGIDNGTRIRSLTCDKRGFRLALEFHHMDEHGGYHGWTEHTVRVYPTFNGLDLIVSGRDRNGIKDYLSDVLNAALSADAPDVRADE